MKKKSKLTRLEEYVAGLPRNPYACDCMDKYDFMPSPIMIVRHSVYEACGKCRRPLSIAISLEDARLIQQAA